ncbi:hypothetical protein GCM10009753_69850 [Streptantibioticus ferralitis]
MSNWRTGSGRGRAEGIVGQATDAAVVRPPGGTVRAFEREWLASRMGRGGATARDSTTDRAGLAGTLDDNLTEGRDPWTT